jgi:hypothetical protein
MQYPETYTLPLRVPVSDQRCHRLGQTKISVEEAMKTCENASASMLEFCDVVRTADVAHGYLGATWSNKKNCH